ncbi:uncharacterized protein LOC144523380 [Sander vitreus]
MTADAGSPCLLIHLDLTAAFDTVDHNIHCPWLCLIQVRLLQCAPHWDLWKSLLKLQYIQNSAAMILMRVRKHDHITPILKSLHWLPVSLRIEYNVSLLTHQCIHGDAPLYLKELLGPQTSTRSLRSGSAYLLKHPRTKLRTMGDGAFCSAAPRLWNALPDHLRTPQTVDAFKRGLKTHLFSRAFG